MPSPFPGMDPYLESPRIWPDVHDALAGEIRNELNRLLPGPYYARLEVRAEVGVVEGGRVSRRIVPDVAVVRHPRAQAGPEPAVAVLDRPRSDVSPSVEVDVHVEPFRHHFVEIRDPTEGHKLVTVVEILSPSNKRPGMDREAYRQKQREVLESDASLIELDLLRGGDRVLPFDELAAFVGQIEPPPAYLVLVSRAWRRAGAGLGYQIFPFGLHEWLPCIAVPLRQDESEISLDLQFLFNRAYDTGPYRRGAVDYTRPPDPPLSPPDAEWAEALLQEAGLPPA